jgi:hypothetical protein
MLNPIQIKIVFLINKILKGLKMLKWIKNLFTGTNKQNTPTQIFDNSIKSMSKAQAIYEIAYEHLENIEQGTVEYPARNRKNQNMLEIWTFTRIEAFMPFLISKYGNIAILGDISKQKCIFDMWFNEKPHLSFPHRISEDESVFNIYIGLAKIVEEVGADEIGRGGKLFNSFNEKMKELKKVWDDEENITNLPFIFDILFEDITHKTKIISLCSVFGPDYKNTMEALIKHMAKLLREEGKNEDEINKNILTIRKNFTDILLKKDPDY